MPSKTKKQARFMAAVANNPDFAKKAGVPQNVGQDFANADKGKTFKEGGMPSYFKSAKGKPGKEVKKYNKGGVMAHDKKEIRNLNDESYRIRNNTGSNAASERRRIDGERDYEKRQMGSYNKGGKVKQGFNARLDDSMGAKNGKKTQGMAARRNESKGMEKAMGKGAYSGASTMMASGGEVEYNKGGKVRGAGMATQGVRACKMR